MRSKATLVPLSDADQSEIRTLYRGGSSVSELARMFHRPPREIHPAIVDLQAVRATGGKCTWCGCLGTTMPGDTPDESGRCPTCRRRPRRAALNVPKDRGTGQPRKLSDANVADIRAARGHGSSVHELARQYAVSTATVYMIWRCTGRFAAVAQSGAVSDGAPAASMDG